MTLIITNNGRIKWIYHLCHLEHAPLSVRTKIRPWPLHMAAIFFQYICPLFGIEMFFYHFNVFCDFFSGAFITRESRGSWVFCIPASYYEHALYILCINTIMLCVFGSCSHYFFTRLFLFFLHPFVSLLFYISFICSYVVQCGQWRNGIFAVGQKRKSQPQSQCSFIPSSEHTHNFTAYFLFFILPFLSHRKMCSRMWWGGFDDSASAGVETWFIGSQF